MPRDSSNVYTSATAARAPNTTITSSDYNADIADLVSDLNTARPVSVGGTGATTAAGARTNLDVAQQQSSVSDATAGRGLIVGAGGLLGNAPTLANFNTDSTVTRFIRTEAASTTGAPSTSDVWVGARIAKTASAAWMLVADVTTGIIQSRVQSSGTWGSWGLLWTSLTAKGTVSQSSDVPTGALFEESDDGTDGYLRLADGSQICTIRGLELTRVTDNYCEGTWSLPKAFISGTLYSVTANYRPPLHSSDPGTFASAADPGPTEILAPVCGEKTTSDLKIRAYRVIGGTVFASGDKLYVDATAVGRWYA